MHLGGIARVHRGKFCIERLGAFRLQAGLQLLPDGGIRLIDWEYAGMCDPMIDVSMATIYSYYNEEEAEKLLAIYCSGNISAEDRFVYYSYIALGGFLWCLWAVYKSSIGEEFGEYTLIMYRYAKDYYKKIVTDPAFLLIGSDF